MPREDTSQSDRLYLKALRIRYDQKPGLCVSILWHLAFQRDSEAMIDLACWVCDNSKWPGELGSRQDAFSPAGLYYRAFRMRNARAAQHLAMQCFNRNDLRGYRYWLRQGAKLGDGYASNQLSHFETRMPHATARRIGRLRPYHKRDETY